VQLAPSEKWAGFLMRVFTEIYAQHLVSYFSGMSLKFMSPDALISAQNVAKMRLAAGLCRNPLGELKALPQTS